MILSNYGRYVYTQADKEKGQRSKTRHTAKDKPSRDTTTQTQNRSHHEPLYAPSLGRKVQNKTRTGRVHQSGHDQGETIRQRADSTRDRPGQGVARSKGLVGFQEVYKGLQWLDLLPFAFASRRFIFHTRCLHILCLYGSMVRCCSLLYLHSHRSSCLFQVPMTYVLAFLYLSLKLCSS